MVCWVVSWSPSLAKLLFKRFECPEKHYINGRNYYYCIVEHYT